MRRRRIVPASITFVTLACSGASAQDNGTARPPQQQEQHVIASPNPTIDDSKTPSTTDLKVEVTRLPPAQGTTAAPFKTAKPKRKRIRARTD